MLMLTCYEKHIEICNLMNLSKNEHTPDSYFLMSKKQIRSLSKSTAKELREAHNIEKMYKAGSFYVQ